MLEHILTQDMIADVLTKSLIRMSYEMRVVELCLAPTESAY